MELSKGANTPIPTSLLAVVISWRSDHVVDAHALLLGSDGSVRGDRDLVFYNAPRHISQAVTLDQDPDPGTARLSVSLPRTEAEVDRIVISGSLEGATFPDLHGLTLTVFAVDGPVAVFTVDEPESVSTLMFGEFYRRDGSWRFRAVGQGWASGMAGLVTEFGIQVDDGPAGGRAAAAPTPRVLDSEGSSPRGPAGESTDRPGRPSAAPVSGDARTAILDRPADAGNRRNGTATDHPPHGENPVPASRNTPERTAARRNGATRAPSGTHPGNAHYRVDETPSGAAPAAPWDRFTEPQPTRQVPGTVTLRRLSTTEPVRLPAPPDPARADWYRDPEDPARLRWWDGERWTTDRRPVARPHAHECDRCGVRRRRRVFGGHHPCSSCAAETEEFLIHWHTRAARLLTSSGPRGPEWEELWASLRYQRIDAAAARAALEPAARQYVERRVAFAFADGQISAEEYDDVEYTITDLGLAGPLIDELRSRMGRGRALSRLREGDLPAIATPDLHLDAEELVYLDIAATNIRELARGPKHTDGRLIVSTKKLRFVGAGAGIELPWSRIVSVSAEYDTVVVAATSARGGAIFAVTDPEYLAAALEGALRIAKRLVLAPGQRDSRSISQEVKAEVWQRDGGRCVECGDSHYLEFDHVIPLSRGGATSAANLQILCRGCNRTKGANI
ncbi:TerD family protein [Nocardia sp. NBC_01329]|uniref:TerD family protein n=1 Tax=Nocardia sp. NBC_01329 TaxID=2903594 RepID=UPI002E13027A|nr:TerD family protein [Nocardia sp. NBC_01329]